MKSEVEIEFNNLCEEYREKFNRAYGINFDDNRPLSEHNKIMKEAIRSGRPVEIKKLRMLDGVVI